MSGRSRRHAMCSTNRVLPHPVGPFKITGSFAACAASNRPISLSTRSEEHTSELQSRRDLVCRLLLEKKNITLVSGEGKLRAVLGPGTARVRVGAGRGL